MLVGSRAGDVYGHRRVMTWGLRLFTIASLAIGAAPNAAALIRGRAVQGVGAAILAPAVLSLIGTTFADGPDRTRALAYYSMVAGGGASLGLVLGGILTDVVSWRVGFLINVPVGITLAIAVVRQLPRTATSDRRIDAVAGAVSTLGMGTLVYGIVRSAQYGWGDPGTIAALAAAGMLTVLFFLWETRTDVPMAPPWLFADRRRAVAYAARALYLGALVSYFFFTTQLMQEELGFTPSQAGLGFLTVTIPTFVAGMLVPAFTARLGDGGRVCLALALATAGQFWIGQADETARFWTDLAAPMILMGSATASPSAR